MASHVQEQYVAISSTESYVAISSTESNDSSRAGATRLPWWVTRAVPLVVLLAVAFGIHAFAGSSPHVTTVNMDAAEMALYGMGDGTESTAPPETTETPASSTATVTGAIGMHGVGREDFDKDLKLSTAETIAETAGVPVSSVSITGIEETDDGAVVVSYSIAVPSAMDANTVGKEMNDAEPDVFAATLNAKLADGVVVTVDSVTGKVPSGGEAVCEGHSYDEEVCKEHMHTGAACCQWDGEACMSAVGDKPCGDVTPIRLGAHPNKCFDVAGGSTANGNNVQLADCVEGSMSQGFECSGIGLHPIAWAAHPNLCLDVTAGAQSSDNIQMWECDAANPNQLFSLIQGHIVWNAHPDHCVAVAEDNIVLAQCDTNSEDQTFSGCEAPVTTPCPTQAPVNPCASTLAPVTAQALVTTQAPVNPCATTLAPVTAQALVTTQAPVNPCATTQGSSFIDHLHNAFR